MEKLSEYVLEEIGSVDLPGNVDSIMYTCSDGGYAQRTRENAQAADVTHTVAFAVDFGTYGEICTAKAAAGSYVRVDIPVVSDDRGVERIDCSREAVGKAARQLVAGVCRGNVPARWLPGREFYLNIAGNGMRTLGFHGFTQSSADLFCSLVLSECVDFGMKIGGIRTGGQTGMDEAGVLAGVVLGIPVHVHAPKDWEWRDVHSNDRFGREGFIQRFSLRNKDYVQPLETVLERHLDRIKEVAEMYALGSLSEEDLKMVCNRGSRDLDVALRVAQECARGYEEHLDRERVRHSGTKF